MRSNQEQLEWKSHADKVSCIDFSPKNLTVATGSGSGDIRLWDLRAMKCIASEFAHCQKNGSAVLDVKFHSKNDILFSSGVDGSFNVYKFWLSLLMRIYQEILRYL